MIFINKSLYEFFSFIKIAFSLIFIDKSSKLCKNKIIENLYTMNFWFVCDLKRLVSLDLNKSFC